MKFWLDRTPLNKLTHINSENKFQIYEKWMPTGDKIKSEILDILSQVGKPISRSLMIKNHGLKRKLHTITPIIEELIKEGVIENYGTEKRPLYGLINPEHD